MIQINLQNRNIFTDLEKVWLLGRKGKMGRRDSLGVWDAHVYTALFKRITNKFLLYSTGNSVQCYVAAWMGGQFRWKSVQFSHSVMSDSFRPHERQHTRLICPSPTPRAYSNSCPLSQSCHPTISSSVIPFSSCLQSFPASGSFPMS